MSMWVGNLPPNTSEHEVVSLFGQFGQVLAVRLPKGKVYGFVDVADPRTLPGMVGALNGIELRGHQIRVQEAGARASGGGGAGGFSGGYVGGRGGGARNSGGADLSAFGANADPKGSARSWAPCLPLLFPIRLRLFFTFPRASVCPVSQP